MYHSTVAASDRCHLSSLLVRVPTRSLPWYLENDSPGGRLLGMTVQRWIASNCSTVGISGLLRSCSSRSLLPCRQVFTNETVNATALGRTNPHRGCNQVPTSGLPVIQPAGRCANIRCFVFRLSRGVGERRNQWLTCCGRLHRFVRLCLLLR